MAGRAGVGAPLPDATGPRGAGARLSSVLSHPISYDGRPAGTPSPDPLRLMKAPARATLSPKGDRGAGFLGALVVNSPPRGRGALSMVRWDRTLGRAGVGVPPITVGAWGG